MTSLLLKDAFERVQEPEARSRTHLAINSLGLKTHPTASDVVAFSTIGTLMRSLEVHDEEGIPSRTKSLTQKLWYSTAYSFLTQAARLLGFKSVSELDEHGTHEQWSQMWEIALTNANLYEEAFQHEEH